MQEYGCSSVQTIKLNQPVYIKQEPYVGEDGIYMPRERYVPKGTQGAYKCILTKEMFVEAYDKWVRDK